MPETAPVLNLLAPDGIVRVAFGRSPDEDQCIALLKAVEDARTADELVVALKDLGEFWGIATEAEVTSRAKPATAPGPEERPAA